MFYAVVFEGMPTVYVNASDDMGAIESAQHLAHYVDKPLRLIFVSAHNDPVNGPSVMRHVWSLCLSCQGKGQHAAGAGENFSTSICQDCHGDGFTTGKGN